MAITKNYLAATTPQRIPVQHLPQESDSCALVWKSASGFDSSTVSVPPRGIWVNASSTILKVEPYNISIPGLTGESEVFVSSIFAGYISGAFKTITLANGDDLPSLSSAYFIW